MLLGMTYDRIVHSFWRVPPLNSASDIIELDADTLEPLSVEDVARRQADNLEAYQQVDYPARLR